MTGTYRAVLGMMMALGCSGSAVRWTEQTAVADSLVRASVRNDSAQIAALTQGSDVGQRLMAMQRQEPALLNAASGRLVPERGRWIGRDSAYVTFRFPYGGSTEVFDVGFVRDGQRWAVYYMALPRRM